MHGIEVDLAFILVGVGIGTVLTVILEAVVWPTLLPLTVNRKHR